jgi:hypothetical protein
VLASIVAAICMERFANLELMVPAMVSAVSLLVTYSSLVAINPEKTVL